MSICKPSTSGTSEKQTTLTSYIRQAHVKSPNPTTQLKKCDISNLSPPDIEPNQKKANMNTEEYQKDITSMPLKQCMQQCTNITTSFKENTSIPPEQEMNHSNGITSHQAVANNDDGAYSTPSVENTQLPSSLVNNIVQPLIQEMRLLKDSVHNDSAKLEGIISTQQTTIARLESTISTQQHEFSSNLRDKMEKTNSQILNCLEENHLLWKENHELKERLNKIELAQLGKNVIISGMQEQPWEGYTTTKERVYETIASAMGGSTLEETMKDARKIDITCCTRIGKYQLNQPRPISVTFSRKEDRQRLLENKCNLPNGIFINEEFPPHMKRNRDILRPILKLAKSLPQYREKSRLQGEKLVINGTHYGVKDLGGLPLDPAAYKAAQKSNTSSIVFHGELSPYSNFHNATFVVDGEKFPTSEHYIQYQKAMLFGDTYTANAILKAETPFEAKKNSVIK